MTPFFTIDLIVNPETKGVDIKFGESYSQLQELSSSDREVFTTLAARLTVVAMAICMTQPQIDKYFPVHKTDERIETDRFNSTEVHPDA